MLMRKTRINLRNIISVVATTAALTLPTQHAQANEEFMLAHAYPTDHIFHMASETFIDELEKQGSELAIDYHPGGDLGDWASIFEQSMDGVIPMSMTFGASEFEPRLDLSWLGYVVDNWDDARKVYGPDGEIIEVYNKIMGDLDLVVLGTIPTGFGSVAIRKGVDKVPTNFPEDSAGIKIRVPPIPIGVERFKNWGFTAVPMPFAELYTALQLGTVDGRAFGPSVEIWQMRDVLSTYILTRDYFEHAFWVVNKTWLDDLPENERAKLLAAAKITMGKVWDEAQAIDEDFLRKVREAGINIVELKPEQLAKTKKILYDNEWPFMEKIVGTEIMDMMRKIAGIEGN